jgi:5'-3' exonuclease
MTSLTQPITTTTALIDGDIVTYRCAAANEQSDEGIARWQAGEMIERIIDEVQASSYIVYLTGGNNFRFDIYPDYKANRKDMVKPRWHATIREYLCTSWNAVVSDGCEADDLMGVEQCKGPADTIICTIDKDLLMIPGHHYNFVKKEFRIIDEPAATQWLYYQALMGDKVDNIPGFDGLMRNKVPKKMQWMIDELYTLTEEKDMYAFVADRHFADIDLDTCLKCLWIWRKENDIWKNPMDRGQT